MKSPDPRKLAKLSRMLEILSKGDVIYKQFPGNGHRIIGLMVEYYPATVEIGVRFPDDAHSSFLTFRRFDVSTFRLFDFSTFQHFALTVPLFYFLLFAF